MINVMTMMTTIVIGLLQLVHLSIMMTMMTMMMMTIVISLLQLVHLFDNNYDDD